MTQDKVRVAVVGAPGAFALKHLDGLKNIDDAEVVAVSGLGDGIQKVADDHGIPHAVQGLDAVLAMDDVDAVILATPTPVHAEQAIACLEAGKHSHLDKPGALTHADFNRMRTLSAERDLTVQMGYMLRYNPAFEFLFHAVRSGWLGEITEIDAAMGKLADARTRDAIKALPGGGLFELGCHMIDAVVTLLGRPSSVEAISTPTRDDGVADNQVALLHYAKATAVLRCNHADPFGGPRRRFMVAGTEGVIDIQPMESGKFTLSLTQKRGQWNKGSQQVSLEVSKDRYLGEFQDLARVVRGEKKLAWDAAHDIAVHETTLLASGQKV